MRDDTGVGALVVEAREAAGLSRAALASSSGISWDTLRLLEEGGEPRLSTLRAIAGALPSLSPAALLGLGLGVPAVSPAWWRWGRDLYGFSARCVRLAVLVRSDGSRDLDLRVRSVRSHEGRLGDDRTRTNLLQAVVEAEPSVRRALVAEDRDRSGATRVFDDAHGRHEIAFSRSLERHGFSYRRTWHEASRGPDWALQAEGSERARRASTAALETLWPTGRLEIAVRFEGAPAPAVAAFAAPDTLVPQHGAIAFLRDLHRDGVEWTRRGDGAIEIALDRPLIALRVGMAWLDEDADVLPEGFVATARATGRRVGSRPAHETFAERLVATREAAGLSRRALARSAGLSPATVMETEAGRDPTRVTLVRLLEALPGLRAADAFCEAPESGGDAARTLTPASAWLSARALFGAEARESHRRVELQRSGSARETIGMAGLRRLRGDGPLLVQDGIAAARHGHVRLVTIDAPEARDDLRIRWRRLPGTEPAFQLHVPAELAAAGASFRRRERKDAAYKMAAEQAGRSIGPAFECVVPARRLVLEARFPRGRWPEAIDASVRAAVTYTNPRWRDLAGLVHPEGLRIDVDRERRVARLIVERPLPALRYSLRWRWD